MLSDFVCFKGLTPSVFVGVERPILAMIRLLSERASICDGVSNCQREVNMLNFYNAPQDRAVVNRSRSTTIKFPHERHLLFNHIFPLLLCNELSS